MEIETGSLLVFRLGGWQISAKELLFFAAFSLLLVIHCIGNTALIYSDLAWMDVMYALQKGLYLLLLVKMAFFSEYRLDELMLYLLLVALSLAAKIGGGDDTLLELVWIAIAAKDIAPRKILSCFAVIKGASLVLTPILWKIGLLPTLYYQNGNGYYNTFGFCHRNVLGANLAILCLAWFWLRYRSLRLRDVILWVAIGAGSYAVIHSRSCLVVIFLVSVCVYLFRKSEHILLAYSGMERAVMVLFLAMIGLSLFAMICYRSSNSLWSDLNTLLTKRLYYAHVCYTRYGLSLFGREIPFVSSMQAQLLGSSKLILDNAYCRAVLCYGLVPSLMYFLLYGKLLVSSVRKKDGASLIALLLMAVYGLSERYMLDIWYQFPLILAFHSLDCPEWSARLKCRELGNIRVRFVLRAGK